MASGNRHRTIKRQERAGDRILRMLLKQALRGERDKDHIIDSTQLKAMELYLRKVKPDLKSVEHTGEIETELEIIIRTE